MGVMVYVFMTLSLYLLINYISSNCGITISYTFWNSCKCYYVCENISSKKWILIFTAFIGIIIIFFDPKLANNFLGLFFASLMALSFALAQVYSRQLRDLDIKLNKCIYRFVWFYNFINNLLFY